MLCFYVRKDYFKQGITLALIREALIAARNDGCSHLKPIHLIGFDIELLISRALLRRSKVGIQARYTLRASSADRALYVGEATRVI
jgi:hypothetical protein